MTCPCARRGGRAHVGGPGRPCSALVASCRPSLRTLDRHAHRLFPRSRPRLGRVDVLADRLLEVVHGLPGDERRAGTPPQVSPAPTLDPGRSTEWGNTVAPGPTSTSPITVAPSPIVAPSPTRTGAMTRCPPPSWREDADASSKRHVVTQGDRRRGSEMRSVLMNERFPMRMPIPRRNQHPERAQGHEGQEGVADEVEEPVVQIPGQRGQGEVAPLKGRTRVGRTALYAGTTTRREKPETKRARPARCRGPARQANREGRPPVPRRDGTTRDPEPGPGRERLPPGSRGPAWPAHRRGS